MTARTLAAQGRFALRRATARRRVLPDFLVIGAMKSGTTSLYSALSAHPQIRGSVPKEAHFFDLHFDKGTDWYRAHFPMAGRSSRRALAFEATPSYLFDERVPARVAQVLPDVRLIAVLREPVARAYSHYQHNRAKGNESLSFLDALAAEETRLADSRAGYLAGERQATLLYNRYSYAARSRYRPQLEAWFDTVGRGRVLVLTFDDLVTRTDEALARVCRFVGASQPSAGKALPRANARTYDAVAPADREHLAEQFRPDVRATEELLGVDLWSI